MVFIKKIKKKSGIYLAEVEAKWVNGRSVHKHIRYIGAMPKELKHVKSKSEQKLIRSLEIVEKLADGKSREDLAILYDVNVKTIDNIKKRFDEEGISGLVHTRKNNVETVKVSTPQQAAIITDVVQNPDKSLDDIIASSGKNMDKASIKKLIGPVLECLRFKKKVILEIE